MGKRREKDTWPRNFSGRGIHLAASWPKGSAPPTGTLGTGVPAHDQLLRAADGPAGWGPPPPLSLCKANRIGYKLTDDARRQRPRFMPAPSPARARVGPIKSGLLSASRAIWQVSRAVGRRPLGAQPNYRRLGERARQRNCRKALAQPLQSTLNVAASEHLSSAKLRAALAGAGAGAAAAWRRRCCGATSAWAEAAEARQGREAKKKEKTAARRARARLHSRGFLIAHTEP